MDPNPLSTADEPHWNAPEPQPEPQPGPDHVRATMIGGAAILLGTALGTGLVYVLAQLTHAF